MRKENKNKLKVYVYAIAKNESKYVDKWVNSMSEADDIYVMLDGTTTDNTEKLLKERGVHVTKRIIKPWRFDTARNESLSLVPKDADVCVCTDLDEIFSKGWRQVIENTWVKGITNQGIYKFWHNAGSPDQAPNIFNYSKIHDRNTFSWKWAVHEYIIQKDPKQIINTVNLENVILYHYPDTTKTRSYKEILEQVIQEEPNDIRYQHHLLKEYISSNELEKADKLLEIAFANPEGQSPTEIAWTYKLACQIAEKRKQHERIRDLCYQALSRISNCRWFYAELGNVLINHLNDYNLGIAMFNKALTITEDFIAARETEWKDNARIFNTMSIGYFYLKDFDNAIKYINECIKQNINPAFDTIYQRNKQIYIDAKTKQDKKDLQ